MKKLDNKNRCFGNQPGKEFYAEYHDKEWGIPLHDDNRLFEMLILEGAQAGLSWETILKRRSGYRRAFHHFDPLKVASMKDDELEALRQDEGIIRNRLKIYAARQNAQVFLKIQQEFGSFDCYLWSFVKGNPIKNHFRHCKEFPVTTPESDALSKDLKKRGMTFVGSTIMYAYMQAVGLVNDHTTDCWCYQNTTAPIKKRSGTSVSAYLILKQDNKILLHLRKNTGYCDGMWALVAGHVEDGESATDALIREVREEIGVEISPSQIKVIHVMHRQTNRLNVDIFFACSSWQGSIQNCEPEKCEKLEFFPLDALPLNTVDYNVLVLKAILNGTFYSELGWNT